VNDVSKVTLNSAAART